MLPVAEPTLASLQKLEEVDPVRADQIREAYSWLEVETVSKPSIVLFDFSSNHIKDMTTRRIEASAAIRSIPTAKWADIFHVFYRTKLRSKLFDSWAAMREENLQSQLESIQQHPQF